MSCTIDIHHDGFNGQLRDVEGVKSFTSPRFWPKDPASLIGSIHVQLAPSDAAVDPGGPHTSLNPAFPSVDKVIESVDRLLRDKISGLEELTIQVDAVRY